MILYGYNRTTGDMDLWVKSTSQNYAKLKRAFTLFGMALFGMTEEKFLNTKDYDVFSFGRPPVAIALLTDIEHLIQEE